MTFPSTGVAAERERLVKHVLAQRNNPTDDYLTHHKISEIIGSEYNSGRYRSVVASSIRQLRKEHRIFLASISGKGYIIGTSKDVVDAVNSGVHQTRRSMKRLDGVAQCAKPEQLTNSERVELNALRSVVGVIAMFTSPTGVKKVGQIALDTKSTIDPGDLARLFSRERVDRPS